MTGPLRMFGTNRRFCSERQRSDEADLFRYVAKGFLALLIQNDISSLLDVEKYTLCPWVVYIEVYIDP